MTAELIPGEVRRRRAPAASADFVRRNRRWKRRKEAAERSYGEWLNDVLTELPIGSAVEPREVSAQVWSLQRIESQLPSAELAAKAAGVRRDQCSTEHLLSLLTATQRLTAWLAAEQALLVSELFDRREGDDQRYVPDELAAHLGLTGYGAGQLIDRAEALRRFPELREAMLCGRIDVRKVDVLIDGTTTLPELHAREVHRRLLPEAERSTSAQLRKLVATAGLAVDPEYAQDRHEVATTERTVTLTAATDGMAWLSAFLPARDALTAFTAIDALAGKGAKDDDRTVGARRADAFTQVMAETLRTGHTPAGTALGTCHGVRPHVVLTVAESTLIGADAAPAQLEGYGPITAESARLIAADPTAQITRVHTDPRTGRVVGVGRTGQGIASALAGEFLDDSDVDSSPAATGVPEGSKSPAAGESIEKSNTPATSDSPDASKGPAASDSPARGGAPPPGSSPTSVVRSTRSAHPANGSSPPGASFSPAAVPTCRTAVAPFDPAAPQSLATFVRAAGRDSDAVRFLAVELGLVAADSYRPSAELRKKVAVRDRTCRFPGCEQPAHRCQIDHIVPFTDTLPAWAQTIETNLHLLCTRHHQLKTAGVWHVTRSADGATIWTGPDGFTFRREADIRCPLVRGGSTDLDLRELSEGQWGWLPMAPGTGEIYYESNLATLPGTVDEIGLILLEQAARRSATAPPEPPRRLTAVNGATGNLGSASKPESPDREHSNEPDPPF